MNLQLRPINSAAVDGNGLTMHKCLLIRAQWLVRFVAVPFHDRGLRALLILGHDVAEWCGSLEGERRGRPRCSSLLLAAIREGM